MVPAAVSLSPLSRSRTSSSPLSDRVTVEPDRYAVVSTGDLTLHAADAVFDTAIAADHALRALLVERPELTGAIQVMPAARLELAEA